MGVINLRGRHTGGIIQKRREEREEKGKQVRTLSQLGGGRLRCRKVRGINSRAEEKRGGEVRGERNKNRERSQRRKNENCRIKQGDWGEGKTDWGTWQKWGGGGKGGREDKGR